MRPPLLVLGQDQSIGITSGRLQRTDTQEEFDYLDVVPIFVRRSRMLWPAGEFSRDATPICWSDDGRVGSSRRLNNVAAKWHGSPCAECQEYTERPWEQGEKTKCQPGYNVVLVDAENYGVYVMRLRGTAARLAQFFVAKGIARRAVVRLYSERTEKATGTWYQLKAKTQKILEEADQDLIQDMLQDYRDVRVAEVDQNAPAQEEETPPVPTTTRGRLAAPVVEALNTKIQAAKEHKDDLTSLFGPDDLPF